MKTQLSYSLWLQSARQQEKDRERTRNRVLRELDEALETLAEQYTWETLYVFGSLIKEGGFTPGSDVDIVLGGLNKFDYYAFVGDISSLMNRTVDVINLEECPFVNSVISRGVKWTSKKRSLPS
jgi:predicted nucleotidyltransferase